ncbi:hypothetical protein [Streptomyces sp. NBC_00162]|uniref:hypothetical protein n=1 Tax=Streptomyces sp. NBC_00162 TaxID=2903629 RepID=UPI00214C09F3|nr:hypothetical protein [Streptomyces sp. NBC_00162]UUU44044.1 hypothetical protein JIW86_37760 [Streptomyces sp. NBC_00162]
MNPTLRHCPAVLDRLSLRVRGPGPADGSHDPGRTGGFWSLDSWREARRGWEDLYPFPFHPDPGGLIPWGHDEHSSEYYFLASDPDPGNWEIVVGSECAEWYRTSGTFTDFLMRCVDGLDRASFMDRAWPAADARFEPFES